MPSIGYRLLEGDTKDARRRVLTIGPEKTGDISYFFVLLLNMLQMIQAFLLTREECH